MPLRRSRPASPDSEICIFNKIYCDIGDSQSLENNLSTFSAHISNFSRLFKEITQNDLVILDEYHYGAYNGKAKSTLRQSLNDDAGLTDEDLRGLSSWELKIARNEIYARRGRLFNDSSLQNYFDSCSWYNGYISPNSFNENSLNKIEQYNVKMIKKYE